MMKILIRAEPSATRQKKKGPGPIHFSSTKSSDHLRPIQVFPLICWFMCHSTADGCDYSVGVNDSRTPSQLPPPKTELSSCACFR